MPRQRSSMRKIREVLRQKWALGLSVRRIARSVGLSRQKWSPKFGQGCKVVFALMRGPYDDGKATQFFT